MAAYSFWAAVFFLATAAASGAMHWYFVRSSYRRIPALTHASILLSVFICLLPFPLLVLDVDAALGAAAKGAKESPVDSWVQVLWLLVFLLTQVMAWVVLPIAQEYEGAGELTWKGRLWRAVRENVKMYVALGVVAGVLMGYILFLKGVRSIGGVVSLCLAAANAFGLTLLVVFLAAGLIGVPRALWRSSSPRTTLLAQYQRARHVHEELELAKADLVDLRAEIARLEPSVEEADRPQVTLMLEAITDIEREVSLQRTGIAAEALALEERQAARHATIVEANVDLKRALKVTRRLQYQWNDCLSRIVVLDGVVAHRTGRVPTAENNNTGRGPTGRAAALYWSVAREPLLKVLAVAAGVTTVLLFWSEAVVPLQTVIAQKLSIVEIVVHTPALRFTGSVVFLCYTATCAYWAIFQVRVFDLYVLVPRISDAASLCFAATCLTRLIIPLCYNFLFVADLTTEKTLVTYSRLFGNMDVVDFLGEWFNRFMPLLVPVLAVLIEVGVFHRLMEWIGVEGWETGEQSVILQAQQVEEGYALAIREAGVDLRPIVEVAAGALPPAASTLDGASPPPPGTGARQDEHKERGQRYAEWKAARAEKAAEEA